MQRCSIVCRVRHHPSLWRAPVTGTNLRDFGHQLRPCFTLSLGSHFPLPGDQHSYKVPSSWWLPRLTSYRLHSSSDINPYWPLWAFSQLGNVGIESPLAWLLVTGSIVQTISNWWLVHWDWLPLLPELLPWIIPRHTSSRFRNFPTDFIRTVTLRPQPCWVVVNVNSLNIKFRISSVMLNPPLSWLNNLTQTGLDSSPNEVESSNLLRQRSPCDYQPTPPIPHSALSPRYPCTNSSPVTANILSGWQRVIPFSRTLLLLGFTSSVSRLEELSATH